MIFTLIIGLLVILLLFSNGLGFHVFDRLFHRLPPGPTPLPFLGNLLMLRPRKGIKPWMVLLKLAKKFGPVFTFYLGQYRAIVISDVSLIHDVIVKQAKACSWRLETHIPSWSTLHSGIIFSNHDHWKRNRRFSMRAMKLFGMGKDRMAVNVQEEASYFVDYLRRHGENKPFDPSHMLGVTVSNVISSFVFGRRFDYEDEDFSKLMKKLAVAATRGAKANTLFLSLPILGRFFKSVNVADLNEIQEFTAKMLQGAIEHHRQDFDPDNIRDFPDLFIQAEREGDAIGMDNFSYVMTDMFMAGTETTATVLCWALLYLTTWPEFQQKCHEAIDAVIDTDRMPSMSDRPRLVYIDAVMCEALRFSCLVPSALLHSNLETPVKVKGYDCPPYSFILYSTSAVHYDESYWGDPHVFRPERWIDEDGRLLSHSGHFMPFGDGPRICLGEALAKVEYFIFITALLHRFEFTLKERIDIHDGETGIVNHPASFYITATSR